MPVMQKLLIGFLDIPKTLRKNPSKAFKTPPKSKTLRRLCFYLKTRNLNLGAPGQAEHNTLLLQGWICPGTQLVLNLAVAL